MLLELIVYACPRGSLAAFLSRYYERARECCGKNETHRFPPHCKLTGFFHDEAEAIPRYVEALSAALDAARVTQPVPSVCVTGLAIQTNWHGLLLRSDWLKALTADFASRVDSTTRADTIRLKEWLHLSLAYNFDPASAAPLAAIARELVDPHVPARWELRLYEREAGGSWAEHACWPLDSPHGVLPHRGVMLIKDASR